MSRPLLNSGDERCLLMMRCGFQVVLKFLFGRMLGVMRSQRSFEYWQLLVRLEASKALGRLQHAGGGLTQELARHTLGQSRALVDPPEPQTRFTVNAGTVTGIPAAIIAWRAGFILAPA